MPETHWTSPSFLHTPTFLLPLNYVQRITKYFQSIADFFRSLKKYKCTHLTWERSISETLWRNTLHLYQSSTGKCLHQSETAQKFTFVVNGRLMEENAPYTPDISVISCYSCHISGMLVFPTTHKILSTISEKSVSHQETTSTWRQADFLSFLSTSLDKKRYQKT